MPSGLPALAQILPELSLDAPARGFEEVEVLEALVAVVADHGPIVLLLDDLHWADPRRWRRSATCGAAARVSAWPS